ncbi:MAG: hypothetical protein AB1483_13840 [Candidatus Zixiibacteriota bacterium]
MKQFVKSALVALMLVALGVAVLPPTATGEDTLPYTRIEQDAVDVSDEHPWGDNSNPGSSPGVYRITIQIALSVYDAIYGGQISNESNVADMHKKNRINDDTQNVTTFR